MSHYVGEGFPRINEIVLLILFLQGIFLLSFTYKSYKATEIVDFKFLTMHYIAVVINMPLNLLTHRTTGQINTLIYALNVIVMTSIFFTIYLHFLSVKMDQIKRIHYLPLLVIGLLIHLPLFFAKQKVIPTMVNYWGIQIHSLPDLTGTIGPLLEINGIIIAGFGVGLFQRGIFRSILVGYGLYAYITVDHANPSFEVRKVQFIWLFALLLWALHPVNITIAMLFGVSVQNTLLFQLFTGVIAFFMLSFIVYRYPTSLLISKSQIVKAKSLYKIIQNEEIIKGRVMLEVKLYMENLPPSLLSKD